MGFKINLNTLPLNIIYRKKENIVNIKSSRLQVAKKKIEINKQESLEKKIKIVWSFSNSRRSFLTTFEHNAWRQVRVSRALTSFVFAGKLANPRRSPAILPDSREIGLFFLFLFCFLFIIIIPELLQGKFLRIFILFCCKLCVILMIFGIVEEIEFFINVFFPFIYLLIYFFWQRVRLKFHFFDTCMAIF